MEEALRAEAEGADYIGCGAVFQTATKSDATPLTLEKLCAIRKAVSIPIVAIGGITAENLPHLYSSGADGIAVVSAIFGQPDITQAARNLFELTKVFQKSGAQV